MKGQKEKARVKEVRGRILNTYRRKTREKSALEVLAVERNSRNFMLIEESTFIYFFFFFFFAIPHSMQDLSSPMRD